MLVTRERILKVFPRARADIVQAVLDCWHEAEAAGITTANRVPHLFAQIGVESKGLTDLDEDLGYSAERLHEVWPNRFKTVAFARSYAHNPQKLANFTYAGRNGNGNVASGDGWRYRGGGLGQTTGRANYAAIGHEDDPEFVRTPAGAFTSAVAFWDAHGLNHLADADNVAAIRKIWNGGTNGMDECRTFLKAAKAAFKDDGSACATADGAASNPSTLLKVGAEGGKVLALQTRLDELGYAVNKDGKFGNLTRDAVLAFQADNGLTVDGQVGDQTWPVLDHASPRPLSPTRVGAKMDDLRKKKLPQIAAGDAVQTGTVGLGIASLGGALAPADALSKVSGMIGPLQSIKAYLTDNTAWILILVCAAVFAGVWVMKAGVLADYRTGRRV